MTRRQFAVWARDQPGMLPTRLQVREAHRARLRANNPEGVVVLLAGPLLDEASDDMCGTMLVVEAETADQVHTWIARDPYVEAGVYAQIDVRPWRCGLGPLSEPQR